MTYGWMLLVVAIVGGAIFSVVQSQSVESVSGFSGGDVTVDDFGVTSDGNLQLILRNSAGESVEVTGIEISGNGNTAEWSDTQSIGVGETGSVTLNSVEEGDGANSLDVEVFYDVGGLENLGVSGSISGNFEVVSDSINYGLSAGYSVNDSSPDPGDAVEFTSTSSPVSEISSYSWSSPDTTLDESSGESITHVFGSEGSYEVNLTVSDGLGNSSSYSEIIDVSSSSVSPADFQLSGVSDNGPVTEGETVNVDYTVSNDGGVSGSQDIVLDVSGAQEDVDSSVSLSSDGFTGGTLSWSTSSGDAGSYSYTVSTENDSVSGTVDVNSLTGPTASASKNVTQPEVGDVVEFDASGSTSGDGSITSYGWDVNGDGAYEYSGEVVTHSYSSSGTKSVELNVTDDNSLSSTDSLSVDVQSGSVSVSGAPSFSTAPSGAEYESSWVPVTSSSSVKNGFDYFFDETSDEEYYNVSEGFYVMKYEAKPYNNDSDSFDGSTGEVGDSTVYVPRSVAANKPWRDISFNGGNPNNGYGAVQACDALDSQTDEFDVHLITNREWMTVARQVEQTDSNWVSDPQQSTGQLIRGWSDGDFSADAPLSASTSDSDGKAGILEEDSTNGWSSDGDIPDHQNRTFELANGEVVWDWAGNINQWVYAEDSGGSTTNGVFDSTVATDGSNDPAKEYEYDPAVVDRSTNGVGGEFDFDSGDAALRGGLWFLGDRAGVFDAVSDVPATSNTLYGFRCSAVPVS